MSGEYEVERSVAREEAVATMQAVVDGVASGTLRFESVDGDPIDVDVPDVIELEIEVELEDDEPGIEVELEWPTDREMTADESEGTEGEPRAPEATEANEVEEDAESERREVQEEGGAPEGEVPEDGVPESGTDEALGGTLEEVPLGPAEETTSLARFEVFRDRPRSTAGGWSTTTGT